MPWKRWLQLTAAVGAAAVIFGSTVRAADEVSGLLTRTKTNVEHTQFTGDVTSDVVAGTPCFVFGASNVQLRLNGFTITGKADPNVGCGGTLIGGEHGVATGGQRNVLVQGPGLIQRFRTHGVAVLASTDVRVQHITASTNCGSGVFIAATSFGTTVESIVSVRNGSTGTGASCGGI
jgi:hypothetical protein